MSLKGKLDKVVDGYYGGPALLPRLCADLAAEYRDAILQRLITTDPQLRPNVARNFDAWYKAFDVKDGSLYLPSEQRIKIW